MRDFHPKLVPKQPYLLSSCLGPPYTRIMRAALLSILALAAHARPLPTGKPITGIEFDSSNQRITLASLRYSTRLETEALPVVHSNTCIEDII